MYLALYFIQRFAKKTGKEIATLNNSALQELVNYNCIDIRLNISANPIPSRNAITVTIFPFFTYTGTYSGTYD